MLSEPWTESVWNLFLESTEFFLAESEFVSHALCFPWEATSWKGKSWAWVENRERGCNKSKWTEAQEETRGPGQSLLGEVDVSKSAEKQWIMLQSGFAVNWVLLQCVQNLHFAAAAQEEFTLPSSLSAQS